MSASLGISEMTSDLVPSDPPRGAPPQPPSHRSIRSSGVATVTATEEVNFRFQRSDNGVGEGPSDAVGGVPLEGDIPGADLVAPLRRTGVRATPADNPQGEQVISGLCRGCAKASLQGLVERAAYCQCSPPILYR